MRTFIWHDDNGAKEKTNKEKKHFFPPLTFEIQVGIFSTSGFFEFCAVRMYKLSRGNLWRLVSLLCMFTAVLSAFLDNVTTILLVVPVTMQLCHVLDVDPVLPVMALVFFSNIGK